MLPKLGLGTWRFGGASAPDPDNDDARDIEAIASAVSAGLRHIDTAESYADGKTEELVGEAIRGFDRSGLFIASKVRDAKLGYDDVLVSCEMSLKRLGIDHLDLYYVHRPNPAVPVAETARALNRLLERGMIRRVGLANASVKTMEAYRKALAAPVFAAQCHYNLIVREPEAKGILAYCREHGIRFVAWRPIQLPVPLLGVESLAKRGAYPLLDAMADKYGKTNAQIAVKWLVAQENVHTLFKTSNPVHLREILETENFEMAPEDLAGLTANFPRQEKEGFTSSGFWPVL